jgi:peptidoglycan hydrolase-like protein with peptidoglycan-binding domain
MKRAIVHLIVAVCVAGLVRADQTTRSVQHALKDQGFYYGNVTGDKSAETTAAIRRYQIRNGLKVTGEMDPETLHSLNVSSNAAALSQPALKPASKPVVTQPNSARPADSSHLGPNPPPPSSNEADRRPDMNPAFSGGPNLTLPLRMSRRIIVAEVQQQLISRGYYQGRVDGNYGRRTAFAMRAFQFASGLPPTGHVDKGTLDALGISGEKLASLQPAPRAYETWVPVTKFKHGKWKVKWKKVHGESRDQFGDENRAQNPGGWWHDGEGHHD